MRNPALISATGFRRAILAGFSLVALSRAAEAVPPAPTNFVAQPPSPCGTVSLSWDPEPGVLGYRLYRAGTFLGTIGQLTTAFIDLEPNRIGANYCLEAFDAGGTSLQTCSVTTGLPTILIAPGNWYNDVFPSSAAIPPGTVAFDRATAVLNTGLNGTACSGAVGRPIDPVDVITVSATDVPAPTGVDMVFRIMPGPGNYCTLGNFFSGLSATMPPGAPCVHAAPGDGSFWGGLMAAPGAAATPGAVAMHAAAPSGWDWNVWNSRPCDFVGGSFVTTVGGLNILPNGLFTPGTEVEYFFRLTYPGAVVRLIPDTNCVMQIAGQGSQDGHRWERFGVLPDLWKNLVFGGDGMACLLVVDYDDLHGDERIWMSAADSLPMTAPRKLGAGTGWHAVGRISNPWNPVDIDQPANNRRSDGSTGFIAANLGQPGTLCDFYKSRGAGSQCGGGGAGALGGRGGVVAPGETPPGPTGDMLRVYYPTIVLLTGNRSSQILGPVANSSENDTGALDDFLLTAAPGTPMPRRVWCIGNGFAQSEDASHPVFLAGDLGTTLRHPNYGGLSGNPAEVATLQALMEPSPILRGVVDLAPVTNDVLLPNAATPAATVAALYEPFGAGAPYAASIHKPAIPALNTITLTDGFNLAHVLGVGGVGDGSRFTYIRHAMLDLLGLGTSCAPGTPTAVDPLAPSGSLMRLAVLGNPSSAGVVRVQLVLERSSAVRVVVVDIAGRRLRTLAERMFQEGTQTLAWDGRDEAGHSMRAGVYVVRAESPEERWQATTKLVILR